MITKLARFLAIYTAVCFAFVLLGSALPVQASAAGDTLSAAGCNSPSELTQGKSFGLKGTVSSETSKIVRLVAGVFDGTGSMMTGRSYNPNAKTVNIRWSVDSYVKFGKLSPGSYTYKITATNAANQQTLLEQSFTVTAAPPVSDKLASSGLNHPTTLGQGKGFYLRGVVSSQRSKLLKVTAGAYNAEGTMLTGRSFNPKAKSVDFRWLVNPYVKFGTLAPGVYTYKVTAVNAAGEDTLLSETFEVTAAPPATDNLKASGLTTPTLLNKGRGFALKGVVSSESSKISDLTVGVFNAEGTMLTGRSFNPKAKSVDLRWYIDPHVKFGTLGVGTYTYKITATNAVGTVTLTEQPFEVVE